MALRALRNKTLRTRIARIFLKTRTEPHLASSATVLELSTGTNNRLDDRGSLPMSTRRRILGMDAGFASRGGGGGGGAEEGPVISTPAFLGIAVTNCQYEALLALLV